jgi:hypothetical protein
MSLCQVEDDRPRTWPASISPWPWWPASSRADATTSSARGSGSPPRGSGFAGGGAATYAGRRSSMASDGRVARSGAETPSSHPDPATLLRISTTACRRIRSAPAPVPTRSPLSGLDSTSSLRWAGMASAGSQAQPRESAWRKRRVPPFSIDPTTADVTVIHRLAASRLRGRRLPRHRAAGWTPERRSAARPVPRSMTPAGRAIGTAPNPGTSEEARSEDTEAGARARTASERDRSAGKDRGDP